MTARGIRNNNPLNIRITDNHWLGKNTPSTDEAFETFDTMAHGIRAAGKILLRYSQRGINTINKIIATFAPNTENPTEAYAESVSTHTGYQADEEIDVTQAPVLTAVLKAMAHVECGPEAVDIPDDDFTTGVNMALES